MFINKIFSLYLKHNVCQGFFYDKLTGFEHFDWHGGSCSQKSEVRSL